MPAGATSSSGVRAEVPADRGCRSFLVRVWWADGSLRASAQDVTSGACRTFHSLAALAAWLADEAPAPPSA